LTEQEIVYPDEKNSEENLVFYYNREERLKTAPQNVKDFYSGKMKKPPKGLFKALVATKELRYVFATLCIVFAIVLIAGLTMKNTFELSAFSFEESVYVSLKINDTKAGDTAEIVFTAYDAQGAEVNTATVKQEVNGGESIFRTTFKDYDIIKIKADAKCGNKTKLIYATVKQQ
jgi:hypothetical protein